MFGIKFAPLDTPLERRLQTLAALGWICLMLYSQIFTLVLFIYITVSTRFWWLGVLYGMYVCIDRDKCTTGGRFSNAVRNWSWWSYLRDFFPVRLIRTVELDPSRNYILCCFPHGILCTGAFVSFATNAAGWSTLFPGIRPNLLTLAGHFMFPFHRELIYALGCGSASAESITNIIGKKREEGRAAILIVGGAAESLYCHPGSYRIILKKRKGFVKLALKNGTPLVPVFSFGETDIYDQPHNPDGSWVKSLQDWIKNTTGIAPAFPMGRGIFQYNFGIIPKRQPITTVVGAPLEVKKNADPTNEDIEKVHAQFTEKLIELFNEHKSKYIEKHENVELVIE